MIAPTKHEGTLAAAEQLGSMSLCQSVGRKGEPAKKNGTKMQKTPTQKFCSACGKGSDTLKQCDGCKCVWYCDRKCQNKHRKEHKKECRLIKKILDNRGGKLDLGIDKIECKHFKSELEKRGGKLDLGPLEKPPPREECPICMHTLPLHVGLHTSFPCCGKIICKACDYQHQIRKACSCPSCTERALQHQLQTGKKVQKRAGPRTCDFCRTKIPNDDEIMMYTRKRAERKEPKALHDMAVDYGHGRHGLPVNHAKCLDLLHQSADLGFLPALSQLGNYHHDGEMGLKPNREEAIKWWGKAAEGGDFNARHNLGIMAMRSRDDFESMRHWRLSASAGYRHSMECLINCLGDGFILHADLSETLKAFYGARAEMRSDKRDEYFQHLKRTGEYKEEYSL